MTLDVRAEFNRAADLHRKGKLDKAISIYRRLVKAQPSAFEIARLLVLAYLQGGHAKEALVAARRAHERNPTNPHAHLLLGACLQAVQDLEPALAAFEAAARLAPQLTEAHFLAGGVLGALGRHAEAVARFDQVLALDRRSTEALANRSTALLQLGRPEDALNDIEALTALHPGEARYWIAKATTLLELDRTAAAAAAADQVIRLSPKSSEGYALKGRSLMSRGRLEEARGSFYAALEHNATDAIVRDELIVVLRLLEDFPAALAQCDLALAATPASARFRQHRAEVRRAGEDFAGAMADVEGAIAADPQLASAYVTRARLLGDLGRPEEIRPALELALQRDPQEPNGRFLTAADDLAHGRWTDGWTAYESREHMLPPPFRPLAFTRWDGRERPEMLVVLGEQGIGDELLFSRLVRLLADDDIRTVLLTRPGLVPLLQNLDARVSIIGDLSEIDTMRPGLRWIAAGSLPLLLQPDPERWPEPPYITASPDRIAKWSWVRDESVFTIGINWQGNPSRNVDVGRSIPLAEFAPLAKLPGVRLVSLQHGAGRDQLQQVPFADSVVQLGDDFNADGIFTDTVGVLHHLDLVISSDTALTHLCGVRAHPAFVALRAVPDWRWGYEGDRSVFFPSLRLFRQVEPGNWGGVFHAITEAVRSMTRGA